jgi:integrase
MSAVRSRPEKSKPADRPRDKLPKYRLHRQSGKAIVTLTDLVAGRKDFLLGAYQSKESHAEYARLTGEWQQNGRRLVTAEKAAEPTYLSVNELLARFLEHAEKHYRRADGSLTGEVREYKLACRPLRELYGTIPADRFTPVALKVVRARMIEAHCSRNVVNARINRIRHVFKWLVSEGLVPGAVLVDLKTVDGLQAGRTEAHETEPVRPVADAFVDAILPYVNRHVRGMIELQRLTGMRPGEACLLRAVDIDMTGPIWQYRPHHHKLAWKKIDRVIPLGPRCQEIIRGFLVPEVEAYLFSPRRAMAERSAELRAKRKTRVQPSQQNRRKRRTRKSRHPGDRYRTSSYGHAIRSACELADRKLRGDAIKRAIESGEKPPADDVVLVQTWSPNRLRHSFATDIRKEHGIEAAQVMLGHAKLNMTEHYAEKNRELAMKVAARVG